MELKKIACGPIFEWVYNWGIDRAEENNSSLLLDDRVLPWDLPKGLACLKKLGVPPEHPDWSAPPEVELVDLPQAYFPLMLLGFNEEKLLTKMVMRSQR